MGEGKGKIRNDSDWRKQAEEVGIVLALDYVRAANPELQMGICTACGFPFLTMRKGQVRNDSAAANRT